MEQENPEWLTHDFLNQCLQSKEEFRKCTTTRFSTESAVPPGYNFGSWILRVALEVKDLDNQNEKTLSLIIKAPLVNGAIKELYNDLYETEPKFYNKYLRVGYKLLNYTFAPDSFHSPIDEIVVLEDLKEKGYKVAERSEQLDFDHCCSYMVAAANFHAMSTAVHSQNPNLIHQIAKERMFSNSLPSDQIKAGKNMIQYSLTCMSENVSRLKGDQRIVKILKACSTTLWDMLVEVVQPNEDFNSFNQGDAWLANVMFKYNKDGGVCDAKLLDFQNLRWASPVNDLVSFIWTSARHDVRKNRVYEMYQIYLEILNKRLEEMELGKTLTIETVKKHVSNLSPVILWLAALFFPMVVKPSNSDLDAMYSKFREEYSPDCKVVDVLYTEEYCKHHLMRLIDQLTSAGVFDYLGKKLNL